ncbi:septum formation family protein [Agromyces sp. M3QZ16-3]|uniref:septum formation family protein n=1 Tax=Agromyces sp. M3QZ16-3 TaxID=3447585 RepID=UPI003F68E57A
MNERDGRYDPSGFDDDTDWLMSQLGSGRRPDLEGRQAPQPPVAPAAEAPRAETAPPSRPRRRSEESLDWFSVAEPAAADDAPTRALPVVGDPIDRAAPGPVDAPPAWNEPAPNPPAWNQPAWNQPAWNAPAWNTPPAEPPRIAEPPVDDRLTSVEPPVGGIVPPAFTRQPEPPQAPPGPVTPPANFALTWGEPQERPSLDTEDGLRAAFRQLADPSNTSPLDPEPEVGSEPEPEQPGAGSPFEGFTPPPVARRSFTPATPSAGAPDDFADELWSALHEDEQPAEAEQGADGYDQRAHGDGPAFDQQGPRGAYDERGAFAEQRAYAEQGAYDRSAAYDPTGYDQAGYDQAGYDQAGYEQAGYDQAGHDDTGYDRVGSDQGWVDGAGHGDPLGPRAGAAPGAIGADGRVPDFAARGGSYDGDGGGRGYGDGFDAQGYDWEGYDQDGYDRDGYDRQGYARPAYDGAGHGAAGADDGRGYGYDDDETERSPFDGVAFSADAYGGDADGNDAGGFSPDAYADTGDYSGDRFGTHDDLAEHGDGYDLRDLWRESEDGGQANGAWSDQADDWREDVGQPTADASDDVRWYADGLAERRAAEPDRPTGADRAEADPWSADESPRAREFAQSGYLWNLTPDPEGHDPKVPVEDPGDEPAPGPRRGAGAPAAADAARDADPFGLSAVDERVDDERVDDQPTYGDPLAYDDQPAHDEQPAVDDRRSYDERAFDDPWGAHDVDERTTERPGTGRPEANNGDDGLAALFGGAGFGATGPMSVVEASEEAGFDRTPARESDYAEPNATDPFSRDERGGWDDGYGPTRTTSPRPGDGDRGGYRAAPDTSAGDDSSGRSPVKILTWVAGGLALVVLIVAVVAFGTRFLAPSDAETAAPVATEEPVAAPTAPQPAGVHPWQALFGTECLEPFETAWAEEFTVVDCASPHTAQLAYRGTFAGDEAAEFPGEEALSAQSQELCAAEGIIDPAAAAGVGDLQMLTAFPVTAEQWDAGQRNYYCFVELVSGEPLAASIAGAGPAAQ